MLPWEHVLVKVVLCFTTMLFVLILWSSIGTDGSDDNITCRYRGKRMRIDYFIVSEKMKDRIISCEMHGRGIELDGKLISK